MDKKPYLLKDRAGDWVAGQRVRRGPIAVLGTPEAPLRLTDSQAEHPLRVGEIELLVPPAMPPAAPPVESTTSAPRYPRRKRG